MKILVYATTFGADLWSFTHFLDQKKDVEVCVLLKDPAVFRSEGVAELFPLNVRLIKRKWYHAFVGVPGFDPDVTIMDNRIPMVAPSPKGMILWHGFGWKGPNDEKEFRMLHLLLRLCWGSAKKPNDDILWQCFGEWDFKHRTEISGIHPQNCRVLGSASHDYLSKRIPAEELQPYYPFDVVNRPTVLFAPTWHYGEVFSHWGRDEELFRRLIEHIGSKGGNVILRLHDSFRFGKEYQEFLNGLADRYDHVMLKFKDYNPDNLLDLQVADMLITNFSSIANLFYATGRPTLHIYPVKSADEEFMMRNQTFAGVYKKRVDSAKFIWKMSPKDNGGLLANSFEELLEQLDYALANPGCCREKAEAFLSTYMTGTDGRNCERIWNALNQLASNEKESQFEEADLVESLP